MRIVMAAAIALLLLAPAHPALALDCARVKSMNAEGTRASDIARQLGITTPDVQSCLAGELEATPRPGVQQPARSLINPTLPSSDSPLPRPPNQ